MYTVKMLVELTPLMPEESWTISDAKDFIRMVNEDGYYRAVECEVDTDDNTVLLARIEKDYEELVVRGYDPDSDEYWAEKIDASYFENNLADDLDYSYFDFGTVEILNFEIVES